MHNSTCATGPYIRAKPCSAWSNADVMMGDKPADPLYHWKLEATNIAPDVYKISMVGNRGGTCGIMLGARGTGCTFSGLDAAHVANDDGLYRIQLLKDGGYVLTNLEREKGGCASILMRRPCAKANENVVGFATAVGTSDQTRWLFSKV